MNWSNYKRSFKISCSLRKISEESQKLLLDYAENLNNKSLPIIFSIDHFSKLVGYEELLIYAIMNSPSRYYHSFFIPKRNRKLRQIREPYPTLKEIQNWILHNILHHIPVSKYAKAYVKGKGLIDNVKFHKNQKVIIKLDIKNFFESITQSKINLIFLNLGYTKTVSYILSSLCFLDNKLPQGAPTSPYLSNIFFSQIDKRIGTYITNLKLRYTRYSDDITISGNIEDKQIKAIISFCENTLSEYGLKSQRNKTKILRQNHCQYVTGVVLNKKISAGTKYKKEIRKEIYFINKYGLDSHMIRIKLEKQNYLSHLLGKINWVLYLEKNNKEFLKYRQDIIELIKIF